MLFEINSVARRENLAEDPDTDHQTWLGIASDGNTLRFANKSSARKHCKCFIDDHASFVRLSQGGSFNGHFPGQGELIIATNRHPGLPFRLEFTPPIKGVGLDVEPAPVAVQAGQRYKVVLGITDADTSQILRQTEFDSLGRAHFIGASCAQARIKAMEINVFMLDGRDRESPVDFGVNRLEMVAPDPDLAPVIPA
jgi:hypothetical protein